MRQNAILCGNGLMAVNKHICQNFVQHSYIISTVNENCIFYLISPDRRGKMESKMLVNSLPNDKISDLSVLKAFTYRKLIVIQKLEFISGLAENMGEKRRNSW